MNRYYQSFRLFFGRGQIRSFVIFMAVEAGFLLLSGFAVLLPETDFLRGFAQGVSTMMGAICAANGIMFLNAIYQYLAPTTAGRKYFLSMPDSGKHFRRAVIVSNVLGMLIGCALLALASVVYSLVGVDLIMLFMSVALLFIAAGICNFTGYIRNMAVRLICIMVTMSMFGFISGFTFGEDEDINLICSALSREPWLMIVIVFVSLAVFAGGLIYSLAAAEKKWGDDR